MWAARARHGFSQVAHSCHSGAPSKTLAVGEQIGGGLFTSVPDSMSLGRFRLRGKLAAVSRRRYFLGIQLRYG